MRAPSVMPPASMTPGAHGDVTPNTRLHGRWLWFARAGWLGIVLLTLGLYLISVPITYTKALTVCTSSQCDPSQLSPKAVLELQQYGLAANFLALYFTFTNVLLVLGCVFVATVIFWRRSNDWLALLGSLMLVTFGIATFSGSLDNLVTIYPSLQPINGFINFCGAASLLLFFYLFPNGRFEPSWTRWLLLFFFVLGIVTALLPSSSTGDNGTGILYAIPLVSILFVQTYRYRKVSGTVERQQTKWVVFGTTMALGGFLGLVVILNILAIGSQRVGNVLTSMFVNAAFILFLLLIPISLMVAILRYRLWEIDLLINRTLVYVPLTAILAGIFAASITLTQKFFVALTGQTSEAATVLTTLIVVAVFDPLKTGLQHLVERRFKEAADPTARLKAFNQQVKSVVQVFNIDQISRRFLEDVTSAYGATSGRINIEAEGQAARDYTVGAWDGNLKFELPLESNGRRVGTVQLSARRNGSEYDAHDAENLKESAQLLAAAIVLASEMSSPVR